MADYRQLRMEWSMLRSESEDWSQSDLQLAAELGKTLLERNKELEAALRQHQNVVDDQAQEIEYLRKQTAALREVNDSRLRIYEQLEVSIQELETTNHRLSSQSTADKRHISSLESQVERLESRCEELERRLEERELEREEQKEGDGPEVVAALREELQEVRGASSRLSSKVKQLQSTVDTVTQENVRLEERIIIMQHKQEELSVMEQVRVGEMCSRCLRSQEEISLTGDEDDVSVIDSLINDDHIKESLRDCENPYRTLVEKYEALLRVQRCPPGLYRPYQTAEGGGLSLQEELELSGEFFHREEDDCSEPDLPRPRPKGDLSETSSGFSDETINKGTQTEAHVPPGAFLCSITDGDDCKFSIYDEANAVDSRFRKTPEYRRLFREIFDVLKRAAEAKDEGESLPLLEDMTPVREAAPQAPPVTPTAHEEPPQDPPPPRRDVIESLAHGVGGRKAKNRKHKNPAAAAAAAAAAMAAAAIGESGGGGCAGVAGAGAGGKGARRRKERAAAAAARRNGGDSGRSTPGEGRAAPWFTPASSASQEVAKLKQLEKSYAEVLRLGREHINRK